MGPKSAVYPGGDLRLLNSQCPGFLLYKMQINRGLTARAVGIITDASQELRTMRDT